MFSRIGRVISNHRQGVGMALIGIGFFWLMGVAGTDDFNTLQHVFNPLLPLVIKTAVGLLITALGVKILNGGDQSESDC